MNGEFVKTLRICYACKKYTEHEIRCAEGSRTYVCIICKQLSYLHMLTRD